ncbi:COMM domain-containing protein 3 [Ixodes scapularis]
MELAEVFVNGIVKAGDTQKLSDQEYTRLLAKVFEVATSTENADDGGANDSDDFKEASSGVLALILEAARYNLDESQLTLQLEEYGVVGNRATSLARKYGAHRESIRIGLSEIGRGPPHITDVDWCVDYRVKNSHLERLGEPVFQIQFKTASEPVSFACNMAQMQDLLHALRDASKCVENKCQGGGS